MFYPAHCDNNCLGCSQNKGGWCIWKDVATPEYKTESFQAKIPTTCTGCPNHPLNGGDGHCNCILGDIPATC